MTARLAALLICALSGGCASFTRSETAEATPGTSASATSGEPSGANSTAAPAPASAGPTRRSALPWDGVYTDASRTVRVTFEPTGYQIRYEDNSVPGWAGFYAGSAREDGGKLLAALSDPLKTQLVLAFPNETSDRVDLTTTRSGHENPRTHSLTRVDPDARARAHAVYEQAFPNKTVAFPKRRAKLLAKEAMAAQEAGDVPRAARLFEAAAVLYRPLTANVANALHRMATCLQPSKNPDGSWERAAEGFGEAARLAGEAGKTGNQALSLYSRGNCLNPAQNPKGSSDDAAAAYAESAQLLAGAGRERDRRRVLAAHAALLHSQAWDHQPDRAQGAPFPWERIVELYREAAGLYAQAKDAAGQARSLNNLAVCLSPTVNPGGSWKASGAAHAEAAIHAQAAGDPAAQRISLRQRAVCLWQDGKNVMGHGGDTQAAHDLFRKAHTQATTAGAADLAAKIKSWLDMTRQALEQN